MIEYDNRAMMDKPSPQATAKGLASYRCMTPYGWLKLGAAGYADAYRQALCLTATVERLEVYDGRSYVPALDKSKGKPP